MRLNTSLVIASVALSAFAGIAADGDAAALHECEATADNYVVEGEVHEQTVLGAPLTFPLTDTDGEPAQAKAIAVVGHSYAMNFVEGNRGTVSVTITWEQASDIDLDVYDEDGAQIAHSGSFNVDSGNYTETASWTPEPCATYSVEIMNNLGVAQDITITTEVTSKAPRVR